jgi:lysophospholipase L1-like esterase
VAGAADGTATEVTAGAHLRRRLRGALARAALAVLFAVLLAAVLAAPAAAALTPDFAVNDDAAYARKTRVSVGDRGHSPFFTPGVVVWDGGSIINGYRTSPGLDFPAQTLRLVPHPAVSLVVWSPNRTLPIMLAQAADKVDANHATDADLNVCLVMAGAGDIVAGRDAATIHEALRTYCLARREAGFSVVVLTLLPRSKVAYFEDVRQALNDLVRREWRTYADGLADVAADPRIGDLFDDLDQTYYSADGTHPNDAGDAVMATITAPVLNQLPWLSDDCRVRLSTDDGEWSPWIGYSPRLSRELGPGEGRRTVHVQYSDGSGPPVEASDSIAVDTVPPVTFAPAAARARRGGLATLRFEVVDAPPCGRLARVVVVKVRNAAGSVLRSIVYRQRRVNTELATSFTVPVTWRAGTYTFWVYASDAAGNRESSAGHNRLIVR